MATVDDVRAIASGLPRTHEALVHDRVKFRVGQIVYLALSRDETILGFAFPKDERDALVTSDPDRFLLPRPSDLRYQWVLARLESLDVAELRELVVDAWRMVVPLGVATAFDLTELLDAALATGDDAAVRLVVRHGPGSPPLRRRAFGRAVAGIAARPAPPVAALEALVDGWAASDDEALVRAAVLAYAEVAAARPDWRDDERAKLRRLATEHRSPAVRRAAATAAAAAEQAKLEA